LEPVFEGSNPSAPVRFRGFWRGGTGQNAIKKAAERCTDRGLAGGPDA